MATERTKAQTAKLYSTRARIFNLPDLTADQRAKAQASSFAHRDMHAVYTDSRGVMYAHDGVSIRRLTRGV